MKNNEADMRLLAEIPERLSDSERAEIAVLLMKIAAILLKTSTIVETVSDDAF